MGRKLGIALSGGGDSIALMCLLSGWARSHGVTLRAATVDHGLRPGARAEAELAGRRAARLGIAHDILTWHHDPAAGHGSARGDAPGNLQDAARRARLQLLSEWAGAHGLDAIATGHTRDDQSETVMLRLLRGSGLDGLSGIAPQRFSHGVLWLRPLLSVGRAALRELPAVQALGWSEDPSNDDDRFDRVRVRKALAQLAPLGLRPEGLAATAGRLRAARDALHDAAARAAREILWLDRGDVTLRLPALLEMPAELRDRLLNAALAWVGAADYPPRRAALHRLVAALAAGRGGTLHGCMVVHGGGVARITRELCRVQDIRCDISMLWDRRWRLVPPAPPAPDPRDLAGLEVRCTGATGLAACPDWRATGLPRTTLLAAPAVWRADELLAAPLAGRAAGWQARAELAPGGSLAALIAD